MMMYFHVCLNIKPGSAEPGYAPLPTMQIQISRFLQKLTDLDLHCLSSACEFVLTTWIKQSDWLKIKSGCDILIYSACQGLIMLDIVRKRMLSHSSR